MLSQFYKDRYFLLRYYAVSTVLSLLFLGLVFQLRPLNFAPGFWVWSLCLLPLIFPNFVGLVAGNAIALALVIYFHGSHIELWQLTLIPFAIYLGMLNVPTIHNCAHNNFSPKWINRTLGELCSLHLLSGFPGFAILHLVHHQHPDDPHLDPHPNLNQTYWQFLNGLKGSLGRAFLRLYQERWGTGPAATAIWKAMRLLLSVNRVLRALMVLSVLGPVGFTLWYLPSIIANQITYSHINYYTHQSQSDGSVSIVDLNHNAIYRFLNTALFGMYFHGTHHRKCYLFNPAVAGEVRHA